jgi:hypothetical protein
MGSVRKLSGKVSSSLEALSKAAWIAYWRTFGMQSFKNCQLDDIFRPWGGRKNIPLIAPGTGEKRSAIWSIEVFSRYSRECCQGAQGRGLRGPA